MKLYFFINSLGMGWAERVVSNVANQLSLKHQITIITLSQQKRYPTNKSIKIISLYKTNKLFYALLLLPRTIYKFKKIIKKYDNGVSFLELANFIHILTKKKAIISFRTNRSFFSGIKWLLYKACIKTLYEHTWVIVVNSEENKKDLEKRLKKDANVAVIYNPVKKAKKCSRSKKGKEEIIRFISIGRLIKTRHIDQIIRALAQREKKDRTKQFIYTVVGEGPQRKEREKLRNELWLKNKIQFLWERKDIEALLQSSHYFLYWSSVEWSPNTILEAINEGIPVFTRDFKTGAREAIIGTYKKQISYPWIGKNWVIINPNNFQEELLEILDSINTISFKPELKEDYNIQTIATQRENILNTKIQWKRY